MQSATAMMPRFRRPRTEQSRQIAVGALVYLVVLVTAAVVGIVYLHPPGHRTVIFRITDGAAVRPGAEVRAAGVPVGNVSTVRLEKDSVRVELTLDASVYVGDQTSVDVRMLTVAGGYYIALNSAGSTPLRAETIPASRAHPPYLLPELLADTSGKLEQIDGAQLGAALDHLASGLEAAPGAVATIVDSARVIAQIVNHQQDQLRVVLDTAAELVDATMANRAMLKNVVQKVAVLAQLLDTIKTELGQVVRGGARMVESSMVLVDFYDSHRDWLLDLWQRINNKLNVINTDLPRIVWNLGNFTDDLADLISPRNLQVPVPHPVLSTDVCAPMPGRTC